MENNESAACGGMMAEPQKEHQWLQQLVGEWTFESEVSMGPDKPSMKSAGTESVRSLGGLWIVGEGKGETPNGQMGTMLITVGYDPEKKKYVGTWVGSMMTKLWVYEGYLNEAGTTLTLEAEGPDMTDPGKTAKYQDIIEIKGNDEHLFYSQAQGGDGQWHRFMNSTYRRRK